MRLDHLLSMENVVEVKRHFTVFDERIPRKTVVQFSGMDVKKQPIVGLSNAEGPPVPIPNTEVKPWGADNTSLETMREDRTKPTPRDPDGSPDFTRETGRGLLLTGV